MHHPTMPDAMTKKKKTMMDSLTLLDDIASMQAHNMNFGKKMQNKCNIIPQDKNLTSLLNSTLC
jgi:hypothetical protein